MSRPLHVLAATALAMLLTACASTAPSAPSPAPATMKNGLLVNTPGMTLYTYDRDAAGSGKSSCEGGCAVKWPPLLAAVGARAGGDFTLVTRANGQQQWAYKGLPLYTRPEDTEPGDVYGDNYNKVWHVVK